MKVAIYFENGVTQIVLTPEDNFEKASLEHLHRQDSKLSVHRGSFYHCQGGWVRHGSNDDSTLLRIDAPEPPPQAETE